MQISSHTVQWLCIIIICASWEVNESMCMEKAAALVFYYAATVFGYVLSQVGEGSKAVCRNACDLIKADDPRCNDVCVAVAHRRG